MDKIDRLLHAVVDTGNCSDEELEAMRDNRDILEDYDTLLSLVRGMEPEPSIDKEIEWRKVVAKAEIIRNTGLKKSFARRVAAVAASAVAIACVAGGVAVGISMRNSEKKEAMEVMPTFKGPAIDRTPQTLKKADESADDGREDFVTFKDETLEQIINTMAKHYGLEVEFRNPDARSIRLYFRWDRNMTADLTAKTLDNLEQITVSISDNKLTIQ